MVMVVFTIPRSVFISRNDICFLDYLRILIARIIKLVISDICAGLCGILVPQDASYTIFV